MNISDSLVPSARGTAPHAAASQQLVKAANAFEANFLGELLKPMREDPLFGNGSGLGGDSLGSEGPGSGSMGTIGSLASEALAQAIERAGSVDSVAVARAAMWATRVIFMDEPTAALGVSQTAMVLELIQGLAASGIAVLVISHNLIDVFSVADRVAILYLGRLVSAGPASDYDRQSAVEIMTTGGLSERENASNDAEAAS